jgi:hypothetical protein
MKLTLLLLIVATGLQATPTPRPTPTATPLPVLHRDRHLGVGRGYYKVAPGSNRRAQSFKEGM